MITYEVITNRNCNLKCYFCFANSNINQSCKVLSTEDFEKGLLDAIIFCKYKNDNSVFVKFYGGETLLYTEQFITYLDVLERISKQNPDIMFNSVLVSNGTIMKDSLLKRINELKVIENLFVNITFSMESNKDMHNKIRQMKNGEHTFDLIISNIMKYFNTTKKYPHIQTVLSPDLLRDPYGYISFMEEYKDVFVFDLVPMFDDTFEDLEDKDDIIGNMKIIFDYYIDRFKSNDYLHLSIFQPFRSIVNRYLNNTNSRTHCDAGCGTISILPDGKYAPCSRYVYNNIDIRYSNIDEYISNEERFKVLTRHDYECKKCQHENDFGCLGKCSALSIKNGDPNFKFKSICLYNKTFGLETNRFFMEVYNTEGFKHQYNRFKYNRNIFKDMEEYILNGGKNE